MGEDQIEILLDSVLAIVMIWGLKVVGGVVMLVVGWVAASWIGDGVARALQKRGDVNVTLIPLARKTARLAVLAVVLIAVLSQFGVQTASFIALLGAAGLAIGLSLQGALSNVASGVLLLALRPFDVGDVIEVDGHVGTVRVLGLFATELTALDGVYVLVSNTKVWNSDIKNFGRNGTRRIDLSVGIGYGDDIDRAIALVQEVLTADPRVLTEPAPLVAVSDLGDSSVDLLVRPWTSTGDWWATQLALRKQIKQRFDAEGISIPFPQRDVHIHQAA